MTHDPYQAHQMTGAYSGLTNPFTTGIGAFGASPFGAGLGWQQQGIYGQNPLAYGQNPLAYGQNPLAYGQNPLAYGPNPIFAALLNPLAIMAQQQQNPYITAALQQNPFITAALQQQNPFVAMALQQQNPYITAALQQNPFVAAALHQQQHSQPFGNPFGQQQLAPQSWVGQGLGQQTNPLFQTRNPWGGF